MALIIPLLMAMVFGYAAIVLQVEAEDRLITATDLGAQATLQAPMGDAVDGCTAATGSFYATAYQSDPRTWQRPSCLGAPPPLPAPPGVILHVIRFDCNDPGSSTSGYLTASARYQGLPAVQRSVTCSATARLDFSHTPLGWIVLWSPTMRVSGVAHPTAARACKVVSC